MPETKQIAVRLPADLAMFWERKKKEIKRTEGLRGENGPVSNASMFEGLVAFWRALDAGKADAGS